MSKSTLMRCLLNGLPLLFSGDYSFFFHYETFDLGYFFLLPYANSNKKYQICMKLKVDDVMQSLRQAFNSAWQATSPTSVCDMCPLHHLHQLCMQLEGNDV